MPGHSVVVVGFSAGGIDAMARLAAGLPRDLPAAVFVAHHFPGNSVSALPSILRRSGTLPALHPVPNNQIEPEPEKPAGWHAEATGMERM
jgi:two-component system chemotaxis response regulator CheB